MDDSGSDAFQQIEVDAFRRDESSRFRSPCSAQRGSCLRWGASAGKSWLRPRYQRDSIENESSNNCKRAGHWRNYQSTKLGIGRSFVAELRKVQQLHRADNGHVGGRSERYENLFFLTDRGNANNLSSLVKITLSIHRSRTVRASVANSGAQIERPLRPGRGHARTLETCDKSTTHDLTPSH